MKNKVETGDVFLSHNKYMNPPKMKYHLCINEKMYFLINTKPHFFNCIITPEDCSLLEYDSYIDCGTMRTEPTKEFKVIKKEQLSKKGIKNLIEKVEICPTLTKIQKEIVLSDLNKCL